VLASQVGVPGKPPDSLALLLEHSLFDAAPLAQAVYYL